MGVGPPEGAAQLQTLTLEPSGGNSDNRESCDRGSDGRNKRWNKQQIKSGATRTTNEIGKTCNAAARDGVTGQQTASGRAPLTPDQRFLITCLDKRFVFACLLTADELGHLGLIYIQVLGSL